MNLKGLNLREKLHVAQEEHVSTLDKSALESLFKSAISFADENLDERLKNHREASNSFDFDRLDTSRIFHISAIKQVATTYRLRFLPLKYFKPELPDVAKDALLELEDQHGIELEGLQIMAPSKLFKLEDKDDPILFAPMGNGYYYLVAQWGNDLHPLRKWLVWPFRGPAHLLTLLAAISFVLTLMISRPFAQTI